MYSRSSSGGETSAAKKETLSSIRRQTALEASSPQERERRAMVHFRAAVTALIWSLWLFGEQRKRDLTFPRRREEGGIEKGEMGCGQRTKGGLFFFFSLSDPVAPPPIVWNSGGRMAIGGGPASVVNCLFLFLKRGFWDRIFRTFERDPGEQLGDGEISFSYPLNFAAESDLGRGQDPLKSREGEGRKMTLTSVLYVVV